MVQGQKRKKGGDLRILQMRIQASVLTEVAVFAVHIWGVSDGGI